MYINDQYPNYLSEVFEIPSENNIQPRRSFQILKFLFPRTSIGQTALSYFGLKLGAKTLSRLSKQNISTRLSIL